MHSHYIHYILDVFICSKLKQTFYFKLLHGGLFVFFPATHLIFIHWLNWSVHGGLPVFDMLLFCVCIYSVSTGGHRHQLVCCSLWFPGC